MPNNAVIFPFVITDELVNILAGFQEEIAAINWGGQFAILTGKDLHVYQEGKHAGFLSRHDGRWFPAVETKEEPGNILPFRVRYPAPFSSLLLDLEHEGYARAHIRQGAAWAIGLNAGEDVNDNAIVTGTLRRKVLEFLRDNGAPKGGE